MSDLLIFYPQGRHLHIEFLGAKYIERQPKTPGQAEMFMLSLRPVIEQLDAYVEKHDLKEIIELNLKDVPIGKLNSDTALHLMNLVSDLRPNKNILEKINIINAGPVFSMIYKSVRSKLPAAVRDIINIQNDSKFF